MRILHRYIFKEILYYFCVLLAVFSLIVLAKEAFEARDKFLDEDPLVTDIIQFVVLSIPVQIVDAIPLITMFAVLFAIGMMARHREILAMVSMGVSFGQIAVPVAVFGLGVTVASWWFSEYLAPRAQARARFLYEVRIKGENQFAFIGNDEIFRKGEGDRFYIMANFDPVDKVMTRPIILDRNADGSGLSRRIEAERARLIVTDDGEHFWEFEETERWKFKEDGSVEYEKFDVPWRIEMEEKLDSFLSREKRVEEMSAAEIIEYRDILERQGSHTQLAVYRTALQGKFALPLACLLLGMIGFAISSDLQVRRFILAFSLGLAIAVSYYVLREGMMGLGRRGFTPAIVAAWGPVLIYALVVVGLMRRLGTVH